MSHFLELSLHDQLTTYLFRFRWVELQINSLCDPDYIHVSQDVDETLDRLPETLEETYSGTMTKFKRYSEYSRTAVESLLKFLMVSKRILTFSEMMKAVSTKSRRRDESLDPDHLVRMSLSLVVIDNESLVFRFAHLSVREFLEKRVDYAGEPAHALAAEACLSSLVASTETELFSTRMRFEDYTVLYWAHHCQYAGTERAKGSLKELLLLFLGLHDDKRAFERWTHAWKAATLRGVPSEIFECLSDSLASPTQPLFVTCVYGFRELVEPLAGADLALVETRNSRRRNCFEVAAFHGQEEILRTLFRLKPLVASSEELRDRLLAAGAGGHVLTFELLRKTLNPTRVDDATVVAAAQNTKYSKEMMHYLLDQFSNYTATETVIKEVAQTTQSCQALSHLIQSAGQTRISKDVLKAGARNSKCRSGVSAFLLEYSDTSEREMITEDIILEAMKRGWGDEDPFELVSALFQHAPDLEVSSHIIEAAAACDAGNGRLLDLFLARTSNYDNVKEALACAAGNVYGGKSVVTYLLDRYPGVEVTNWALQKAALNEIEAQAITNLLLAASPELQITEETLLTAVRIPDGKDGRSLSIILERKSWSTEILL